MALQEAMRPKRAVRRGERARRVFSAAIVLVSLVLLSGCGRRPAAAGKAPAEGNPPRRIVTLAPNLTEIVYALGLGDRLVGNTAACAWPPQARRLPHVGRFGRFNIEAILRLHPDLAVMLEGDETLRNRLRGLGIETLSVRDGSVDEVLSAVEAVGRRCGVADRARQLTESLRARLRAARERARRFPRRRVLLVFGRTAPDAPVERIFAIGPRSLHGELLEAAGGENVVETPRPFVELSREAILRLDPDWIIELAPDMKGEGDPVEPWRRAFPTLRAVEEGHVRVLRGDYLCIPGPRIGKILDDFLAILQPEKGGGDG